MDKEAKKILVVGATGKQGSTVLKHLLHNGWGVRALTRNASKAKLPAHQQLEVVEGDIGDIESIKKVLSGVYGVYYMLPLTSSAKKLGVAFAGQVYSSEVKHLVFSSVGGTDRDNGVAHFQDKLEVENHIRELGIPATILRPVAYMEDIANPRTVGIILSLLYSNLPDDKRFQVISLEDIGAFTALAFAHPEAFMGKALEIAGDELTVTELALAVEQVTGRRVRYRKWPKFVFNLLPKIMREMMSFYARDGWQANISELRQMHPELMTFKMWLEKNRHLWT